MKIPNYSCSFGGAGPAQNFLNGIDMNNWWLISDTHFSHTRIMEFCGRPEDHEDKMRRGLLGIPRGAVLIHLV